jgi:hypothetical protein
MGEGKTASIFSDQSFLTWCEQSSIFQYVGNLTLTTDPSSVEHFLRRVHSLPLRTRPLRDGLFSLGVVVSVFSCASWPSYERSLA